MSSKKLVTSIIILCFLSLSVVTVFYIIPTVKADSITNVDVTLGVVNVLVSFNVPGSSDTVYIKFDTNSNPTSGTSTYTDPTDLLDGEYYGDGGTQRDMLIRGLNESTTYYYAFYLNGVLDTSAPYPSFTTLDRYTIDSGWGDEFLDDYLIDDSSGISFNQNTVVKSGVKINNESSANWNMFSIVFANNTYHCYAGFSSPIEYSLSNDGLTFGNFTSTGVTCAESQVCWDYNQSKYVLTKQYTDNGQGNTQDIWVANTSIGSESSWSDRIRTYIQSSATYEPVTINYDSLGANRFVSSLIWHGGAGLAPRYGSLFFSIPDDDNYSKWIMIKGDKQHTTYANGIGFKNEQLTNSDGFYGMSIMVRNQMYIGFLQLLEGDQTSGGRMNFILTYSRNGYDWYPFVTNPVFSDDTLFPMGANGEWDDGLIRPDNMVLHTVGEIDRIYWAGKNAPHGSTATDSGLSYSTVRTQGITFINSSAGNGWLRTVEIPSIFASNFTINGNFTSSAKLNISILDADTNTAYSGFSFSDFNTITTDSVSHSPTWGSNTIEDIPSGSFKINFSWDGSGSGELYSYSLGGRNDSSSDISIQNINGLVNNSVTQYQNRSFNWTKVNDTVYYQLQISNSSSFDSTFVDLSDINETNYGADYTEVGDYVEFILPDAYNISWYGYHYYRVRAYTQI